MARVSYQHISKVFDDGSRALEDFDLQIDDGELMVLVGPSGCGKSTALRLLAGLESVSDGRICIDDENINGLSPRQRNIAMVFQNYALYPHMSVRRNLEFPLRMMNLSRDAIKQRTERAAQLLQLDSLMDRRPAQLSGGQRQRVAMGRAIVREPRVFLMDEPLSNLDAELRVQIRTDIFALQRRLAVTTLYVTHDQVEAMTLGDRVAVMNAGRLQQVDRPQVLYNRPANVFVARFLGSPGMNVFRSHLHQRDKELVFELGDQRIPMQDKGSPSFDVLRPHTDQSIHVGFRPEAVAPCDPDDADMTLAPHAIEALGHEQLLYFTVHPDEQPDMIVRVQGAAPIDIDDSIPLRLDRKALYFFDADGRTIDTQT